MARHRTGKKELGGLAIVFAATGAWPACAQTLGLAPNHDVSPWRIVGALLFCCVLGVIGALALRYRLYGKGPIAGKTAAPSWPAWIAGLGLRSRPAGTGTERLKLVETVRLGYQVEVNLLDCDGRSVVVVTSPHGAFIANPDAPGGNGKPS